MTTNIRFFYNNLLDISTVSLTASSESTNMPAENVLNPLKSIPWQTTGVDFEHLDIDLGQNYQAKAFAAAGINYTENAKIILCADNSETFYQDIDSNHIGFWKFNGDLTDAGSSENDLTGATVATTDYFAARQDRALQFNGTDAYCYIPDADASDFDFAASDDFSIEIWFDLEPGIGQSGLISKWDGTKGFYLEIDADKKVHFKASDGTNTDEITSSTAVTADRWYHAAISADRDGQLNLYIDGSTAATPVSMTTSDLSNSSNFRIARHETYYLAGSVAMAGVSNSVRDADYMNDASNTPMMIKEIENDSDNKILLECFNGQYARYWRLIIADENNTDGYLNTGIVYIGDWFEPQRNYHGNWSRKIIDPSKVTTTSNNVEFSDIRKSYIEIDLSFPREVQIPQSDIEQYEEMFSKVGTHKRLFIALDYGNHPRDWSYYGTLTGSRSISHLPATSHTDGRWIIPNLRFKESR